MSIHIDRKLRPAIGIVTIITSGLLRVYDIFIRNANQFK